MHFQAYEAYRRRTCNEHECGRHCSTVRATGQSPLRRTFARLIAFGVHFGPDESFFVQAALRAGTHFPAGLRSALIPFGRRQPVV